jgi:hypothetical protein
VIYESGFEPQKDPILTGMMVATMTVPVTLFGPKTRADWQLQLEDWHSDRDSIAASSY